MATNYKTAGDLALTVPVEDKINTNYLDCICSFAYFWSFASFLSSRYDAADWLNELSFITVVVVFSSSDLEAFNSFAVKTITSNNSTLFVSDTVRLYECEINLSKKKLLPIKRKKDVSRNGDAAIFEVNQIKNVRRFLEGLDNCFLLFSKVIHIFKPNRFVH